MVHRDDFKTSLNQLFTITFQDCNYSFKLEKGNGFQ